MSRLPPLNALKAFEAAARHLSFTRGAEALNVSQSAISHQVRLLETHVGKPLFNRSPSGLALTEEGTSLYETVHEAFDMIVAATSETRGDPQDEHVTIMLRPFLSFNWLSPRLSAFQERYPDNRISLRHVNNLSDFESGDFDIAIVLGERKWPNMDTSFLMPCELTPVCSPALVQKQGKPRSLSDLATNTLLHEQTFGNWTRWLALAGGPPSNTMRHIFIDDTNVRIQAAIKGQGVTLSNQKLLSAEFEAGNLVAPFDIVLADYNYHIVSPKNRLRKRRTRVLRDWLKEQAQIFSNP